MVGEGTREEWNFILRGSKKNPWRQKFQAPAPEKRAKKGSPMEKFLGVWGRKNPWGIVQEDTWVV